MRRFLARNFRCSTKISCSADAGICCFTDDTDAAHTRGNVTVNGAGSSLTNEFAAQVLLVGLLTGCASTVPTYGSFDDVAYPYDRERTLWSARAHLNVRVAEITPNAGGTRTQTPLLLLHPWGLRSGSTTVRIGARCTPGGITGKHSRR